jgi:hypothetical protein
MTRRVVRDTRAWHVHSAVTVRSSHTRRHGGALIGSSVVAGQRQGDADELTGPQGGRRAIRSGVDLT